MPYEPAAQQGIPSVDVRSLAAWLFGTEPAGVRAKCTVWLLVDTRGLRRTCTSCSKAGPGHQLQRWMQFPVMLRVSIELDAESKPNMFESPVPVTQWLPAPALPSTGQRPPVVAASQSGTALPQHCSANWQVPMPAGLPTVHAVNKRC